MLPFLKKPYPIPSARSRWLAAFFFGLFVFLFLQVFQPFGLSTANESLWPYTLGYGVITFCMTALLSFLPQYLFPALFDEDSWTVGGEITITLVVLLFIALGNWVYSAWLGITGFGWNGFLSFVGYTLAVGVFPIAAGVLIRQNVLARQYIRRTEEFKNLATEGKEKEEKTIAVYDQDGDFIMELPADKLFAVKNAENYVELYYLDEDELKRRLIRSTMASMENLLSDYSRFYRVHRSWIANLFRVRKIDGNARGYDLFIHDELPLIPVSRSRIDPFEEQMQSLE